jgi:TPR repeat protein
MRPFSWPPGVFNSALLAAVPLFILLLLSNAADAAEPPASPAANNTKSFAPEYLRRLQAEAQAGDPAKQAELAVAYEFGMGVPQDFSRAVYWLKQAANHGSLQAQTDLGSLYMSGLGISPNPKEGFKWHQRAASEGYIPGIYNLGIAYLQGQGTTQNLQEAARLFVRAAQAGYPPAQANYGLMLMKGDGTGKDSKEAVRWFQKAAKQGFFLAEFELGFAYELGEGVDQDFNEAMRWYRKSAEHTYPPAQVNLGRLYLRSGTPENVAHAIELFLAAARQGNAYARQSLAVLLSSRAQNKDDYVTALMWCILALKADPSTETSLNHLMNNLKERLTPEQQEEAAQKAAGWLDALGVNHNLLCDGIGFSACIQATRLSLRFP